MFFGIALYPAGFGGCWSTDVGSAGTNTTGAGAATGVMVGVAG